MALGGDFEALKQLAIRQDADRQALLAKERAAKEQQSAKQRAERDARERKEREEGRRLIKLKEDQKKRQVEAQEELQSKRDELLKRKREREYKAAEIAKVTKTKLITAGMIRQREKAGLGGRKSKTAFSSSSSSDYLPLTRQEKRERREREALGLDIRKIKPLPTVTSIAGPSVAVTSAVTSQKSAASSARPLTTAAKGISPAKKATTSATLRSLEKQLLRAESDRKRLQSSLTTKESSIKLRDAEAAERTLRRRIAMDRKVEEEAQLARIRSGLPPLSQVGGSSEEEGPHSSDEGQVRGRGERSSTKLKRDQAHPPEAANRPATAREKFLREEIEKKAKRTAKEAASVAASGRKKNSMHFSESEDDESEEGASEQEEDDDDGFIDDGEEGQGYDIWSIMNPGKAKAKYLSREVDSDDDMEADADSVFREDQRSSTLARLEDRREEERLRKHDLEKAKRKKSKAAT